MLMKDVSLRQAEQVQRLAQEYASYSASKSGLGNVLGGMVGIAVYLINGLLGRSLCTTILTIGLTIVWFGGKEVLRARFYQTFGAAQESPTLCTKKFLFWVIGLSAFTALGLWGLAWIAFLNPKLSIGPIRLVVALVCATSMPWLGWRYLRTLDEFMIGFFLLICCTITSLGSAMVPPGIEGWLGTLWVPGYALILLRRGIIEHRTFRLLAQEFQARKVNQ
jgi:hypothetical protein